MKNALKYLLYAGIAAIILWLAFRNQDPSKIWNTISSANPLMVFFSVVLLGLLSHVLRAWRWNLMLQESGKGPGTLACFLAVMTGYLFNYGIPRSGELARCGILKRTDDVPIEKSLGTVIAERLVDLLTLGLIVFLAFVLQFDALLKIWQELSASGDRQGGNLWIAISILGMVGIAGFYLMIKNPFQWSFLHTIQQKFKGFVSGLLSIQKMKNPLLFIILSLGIWALYLLMMYFSFYNLKATSHLGIAEALTVLAVGTFGMVIPAPGGMGSFHYFTTQALLLYHIPEQDGLAYATVVHGAQMIMFLTLGPICMIWAGKIEKNKKNAPIA